MPRIIVGGCCLLALTLLGCASGRGSSNRGPNATGNALVCPPGASPNLLGGERGRVEFCAKGRVLHGPAREWYPNGVQRSSDHWIDGKPVGTWTVWDENGGKREERSYVGGSLEGRETYWYSNGQRRSVTYYCGGAKNGPVAEWSDSGIQVAAGQFDRGSAQGTWTFREPTSGETFEVVFDRGQKVSSTPIEAQRFQEWQERATTCPKER
jgi:hypothetical protein